jgi:hypothetical protein
VLEEPAEAAPAPEPESLFETPGVDLSELADDDSEGK